MYIALFGIETKDTYILFKQRKTRMCNSIADQHFLFLYLDLSSFRMWGSFVSTAIYCRANPYTWFININDKQHKGVTAQLIQP